jgi:hypothetical protein
MDYRPQLMAKQRLKGYHGSVSNVNCAATISGGAAAAIPANRSLLERRLTPSSTA